MANESSGTKTTTPSSTSSAADSYIGSFISLTSKYEIRYEGVLYYLNPQDSTLGLKNVKSYGTEGRKKDGLQIPPSDKVYEYILFRGNDIKDLQVKSSPRSQVEEPIHNDPAIIQSQFATGPSSSSKPVPVNTGSLTEFSPYMEASALNIRSHPNVLSSHQPGAQVGVHGPSQTPQDTNFSSYAMPMLWQGYSGATNVNAYAHQHQDPSATTSISTLPYFPKPSPVQASMMDPLTSSSISLPPMPMPSLISSNPAHPNSISFFTPEQLSIGPTSLPSLSTNSALSFHPGVVTANTVNIPSFPSSAQNVNKIEATNVPVALLPAQSLSYSASSIVDSTFGPLLKQSPMLLTPDQLSQSRLQEIAPTQSVYDVQKDMGVLNLASSNPLSSITTTVTQSPVFPLQPPRQQFTEEFDFEAMNEKFKKDEVWGYLGKAKQRDNTESIHDNATVSQTSGDPEGDGMATEADSKPAYNKDEFFDSISCNTTARRGRSGQNHFSERMKQDTETFGQFQQRTHPGYGGYGGGRGQFQQRTHPGYGGYGPGRGINRNPYSWGRGYNSSSRGRGGNNW